MEERLAQVRARLKQARGDNLAALEEETREPRPQASARKRRRREKRHIPTLEDSDADSGAEEVDPIVRGLNARAARLSSARAGADDIDIDNNDGAKAGDVCDNGGIPVVYGGSSADVTPAQRRLLASDLSKTEEKRKSFHRRRAFVEDRADISFINDGNLRYNRSLKRAYDGFEQVRKIKDSLERGTALP